ncbi:hypothetical protein POM88_045409 [Heracleum sosnowskyi]|uniref:Uncharacterized protein n=1 Tax=Heracleum sosnowskyi TaxID=360622 RepID=A0AAD8H4L6_9APIA|nr:hypothetical protein POM88_045408 [Heracleum sosnowskyi]KAK1360935.1 hypothetical protein POM88_045409 [Heracleum sosnowskyi]
MAYSFGHDDELMWDGLACPPLEDYAFNFDTSFTPDDGVLDDLLLEIEEEDDEDIVTKYFKQDEELDKMVAACMANPITPLSHDLLDLFPSELAMSIKSGEKTRRKPTTATRPCGKGKEIKILGQLLQVEMHSKTFYGYHPKQQPVKVVEVDVNKMKSDRDLKSKGGMNKKPIQVCTTLNHKRKAEDELRIEGKVTRCGNHGKGKNLPTLDEAEIKAILGETKELVEKKDKKRIHSDCEPMQQKDMTKLDSGNRHAAGNKRKTDPTNQFESGDYDLKLEASTQKLHEAYQRDGEAKQKKQIQLIDFQIPMMKQPRCNAKTRGKPSLRQRLMAIGTHKSNNKFPPFSSCPIRKTMFV